MITVPAQSAIYAQINCMSQLSIVKVEPYFFASAGCGYNNDWEDDDDYGYGYDNYGNEGNGWNTSYVNQGNGWVTPIAIGAAPPMPMCMSQMEFMQMKNSIANKSFESSKLQMAKQALAYNYFSSAQVADLMSVFSFESTRLDFAKKDRKSVV